MLFLLLLVAVRVAAIVLRDLPDTPEHTWPSERDGLRRRRAQLSSLDLRSEETFTWGGSQGSDTVLAHLTVYMPSDQENILSLNRFKGLLKSVDCTPDSINLGFRDEDGFEYAKNIWHWVNTDDSHSFVLVANTGECTWNDRRVPFTISKMSFNTETNSAHLKARASTWQNATHTYTLQVGTMPRSVAKVRRQFSDVSLNPTIALPVNYHFPIAGAEYPFVYQGVNMSIAWDCDDCRTTGQFQLALHMETRNNTPTIFDAVFQPMNVSARFVPKITVAANFTPPLKFLDKEWPPVIYQGFEIPGVMTVHPELVYSLQAELGPISGSSSLSGGTIVTLPDDSHLSYTPFATGPTAFWVQWGGWVPVVRPRNWILDGKITGDLKIFGKARFQLKTIVLGIGIDMTVGLDSRAFAKLENVVSFGAPACYGDPQLRGFGVNLVPRLAADVHFLAINARNGSIPFSNITIGKIDQGFAPLCFPYGTQLPTAMPSSTDVAGLIPDITSTETANFSYIAPETLISNSATLPALLATTSSSNWTMSFTPVATPVSRYLSEPTRTP